MPEKLSPVRSSREVPWASVPGKVSLKSLHVSICYGETLRLELCDIGTVEISETSTLCIETRQMSVLTTEGICPVSAADIRPVSTSEIRPVSPEDIYPVSRENGTAAGQQLLYLLFLKALALPGRAVTGSTRRGLTRGEESERGERVH